MNPVIDKRTTINNPIFSIIGGHPTRPPPPKNRSNRETIFEHTPRSIIRFAQKYVLPPPSDLFSRQNPDLLPDRGQTVGI